MRIPRSIVTLLLIAGMYSTCEAQDGLSGNGDEGELDTRTFAAIQMILLGSDASEICTESVDGDDTGHLQTVLDRGDDLSLCSGQTYELTDTLHYRANFQEIYTLGNPIAESEQARLEWMSENGSKIIRTIGLDGIRLHHVTIDGNRELFGLDEAVGDGMVELLDARNAYIAFNHLKDPRTWTALHAYINCDGIRIEHNQIGPSRGGDGISFECEDGEVAFNEVTDAGDGAIVLFGAAGSKVHHNVIRSVSNVLLGGINLVDPTFNYQGTEVYQNTIIAEGGRILVGIAMGPGVWGFTCGGEAIPLVEGASVYANHLQGDQFRFGYVLNGVRNFEFRDNTADATFSGSPEGCAGNVATPRAFACQLETVNDGVCPPGTDVIERPENLDGVIFPTLMD